MAGRKKSARRGKRRSGPTQRCPAGKVLVSYCAKRTRRTRKSRRRTKKSKAAHHNHRYPVAPYY